MLSSFKFNFFFFFCDPNTFRFYEKNLNKTYPYYVINNNTFSFTIIKLILNQVFNKSTCLFFNKNSYNFNLLYKQLNRKKLNVLSTKKHKFSKKKI